MAARALVLGGSGFIGRSIVRRLCEQGWEVRVPTRDRERAKSGLILLPTVDLRAADIHDPRQLDALHDGVDVVINLIGVLHDRGGTFQRAHVELPRQVVEICRRRGVARLLHMSALGASPAGPSRYLRSKGEGERIIGEAGDLNVTIFRPSVVIGDADHVLTLFARMAGVFPVIPLACAQARFQPVHVEDVARAMVCSLTLPATRGQRYDLCGPKVYTLEDLVRHAARQAGHDPIILRLPAWLGRAQAAVMEHLPGKLLTRDNLDSMRVDSVSDAPFPAIFGFAPAVLESVTPHYLANARPRSRYNRYRARD